MHRPLSTPRNASQRWSPAYRTTFYRLTQPLKPNNTITHFHSETTTVLHAAPSTLPDARRAFADPNRKRLFPPKMPPHHPPLIPQYEVPLPPERPCLFIEAQQDITHSLSTLKFEQSRAYSHSCIYIAQMCGICL